EVDHRADIYSLGILFYELLTGELPLGNFALPSATAGVDVRMDQIVLRAMEREPLRRFQHMSDLKSAIEEAAGAAAVKRDGAAPGSPFLPLVARETLITLALALVAVSLTGVAYWLAFLPPVNPQAAGVVLTVVFLSLWGYLAAGPEEAPNRYVRRFAALIFLM